MDKSMVSPLFDSWYIRSVETFVFSFTFVSNKSQK